MAEPRPITRDVLAKFLPDPESIRRFEKLFYVVSELTPSEIAALKALVQEASIDANTAQATAQSALDQLGQIIQDAAINAGSADGKATQALGLLSNIAQSLEVLASAPAVHADTAVRADYVDFPLNGPHVTQERRLQWNLDDGTLDMGLFNGVVLQVGQETMYYAKNTSGVTISDGQSVMATGSVGASGKLTIAKAVSDGSVPAHFMIGVATQDIAPNQFGYVTSFGLVRNINTTGAPYGEVWADGDLLYFNPVIPGGLTNVQPEAPELKTPQAIVVVAGTGNGSIFVRMSVGMKLGDSDDVHAPSPVAGNILVYDATQDRWEAAHITAGTNVTVTNADGAITLSVSSAAPSGAAGGVLSGTYPSPGFAVDMATQAELDAHTGATAAHGATGAVVGTTNTQTLTNKTINLASNTLAATSAQLAAAVTDETGSGALVFGTSPTLTTPKATTTIGVGNATPSASGAGITFPATQSASTDANTLDDYEEGTWTPTVVSASGVVTLTGSVGQYTKIGRWVHFICSVTMNTDASVGTSNLSIGGLPFTPANTNQLAWLAGSNWSVGDYANGASGMVIIGTTTTMLHQVRTINISSRTGSTWWYVGSYQVA